MSLTRFVALPLLLTPVLGQDPAPALVGQGGPVVDGADGADSAGRVDTRGSLAAYFDDPAVYLEIFDLAALGEGLEGGGIGELIDLGEPLFSSPMLIQAMGPDQATTLSRVFAGDPPLGGFLREEGERYVHGLGLDSFFLEGLSESLGERISVAALPQLGGQDAWVLAFALSEDGAAILTNDLVPMLQDKLRGGLKLRPLPSDGGAPSYLLSGNDVGNHYLVVKPDLVAWTPSRPLADRLATEGAERAEEYDGQPGSSGFRHARSEARSGGQALWAYVRASMFTEGVSVDGQPIARAWKGLGLDHVEHLSFGLTAERGRLSSRLRLAHDEPVGILDLLESQASPWSTLEYLTSDAVLAVGVPRSPRAWADRGLELLAEIDLDLADALADEWLTLEELPVLGPAFAEGALGEETLLFVRPGPLGLPTVCAVVPASPALVEAWDRGLAEDRIERGGYLLRKRTAGGRDCWLVTGSNPSQSEGLCVTVDGGALVMSDSVLSLQDYFRRRARERLPDREAAVAEVRSALARVSGEGGVAVFGHVRMEAMMEWLWPLASAGLLLLGGEDLGELPDAFELAESLGDTTWAVRRWEHGLEWVGSGLLGGLFLIL